VKYSLYSLFETGLWVFLQPSSAFNGGIWVFQEYKQWSGNGLCNGLCRLCNAQGSGGNGVPLSGLQWNQFFCFPISNVLKSTEIYGFLHACTHSTVVSALKKAEWPNCRLFYVKVYLFIFGLKSYARQWSMGYLYFLLAKKQPFFFAVTNTKACTSLQWPYTKTLQPEGTLGNWRRSIVTVIHVCTSFSQRVINRWTKLSQEDVDAQSINCFKNRLEKRRTWQMDFFSKYLQSTSPVDCKKGQTRTCASRWNVYARCSRTR